jgi:hypothetical protein
LRESILVEESPSDVGLMLEVKVYDTFGASAFKKGIENKVGCVFMIYD